ncbi:MULTISPECIES: fluoride efflux transporter CrcB [Sphingomonas]|uniref:Fluoride-specific ion channel FluC n=1 Tax=Sphingomonas trueperi TaxID=53317 RepID=A0A7X5XWT0_9SPHN|nr:MULTISPECIES: fluoride efflux transporter CrcB [Sphingomonas]NJB96803.1 CrcB protein [Sphingomonas trueperi]
MPLWLGFLGVFLGSGLGGMARYGVGILVARWTTTAFPWGTFIVNVAGAALMGLIMGAFAGSKIENPALRLFLTTGILGGLTTWSTFSLDAVALWERGEAPMAVGYVLSSLVLSLGVLAAALVLSRRFF